MSWARCPTNVAITGSVVGGSYLSLRLCACGFNFRDAVLAGLSRLDKAIPRRFLFDDRGSALFEAVCTTPEYYIWRIKAWLIESRAHAPPTAPISSEEVKRAGR